MVVGFLIASNPEFKFPLCPRFGIELEAMTRPIQIVTTCVFIIHYGPQTYSLKMTKYHPPNLFENNPPILALDTLRPDYTNTYDILDETKRVKREKRDRKALTNRVRKRLREELKEAARIEKK